MEKAPPAADIDDSCTRILINDLRNKGLRLCVLLNGVECERVLSYDTAQGWVKRYKLKDGQPYVDPGQDRAATEVVKGSVQAVIVRL